MFAIHIPPLASIDEAFAWLAARGEVVRVVLYRGEDGYVRGSALLRGRT